MSDLMNRLAALRDDNLSSSPTAVEDRTVAADLSRGRAALAGRRHRRLLATGAFSVAVLAIGSLSYELTGTDRPGAPPAAAPHSVAATQQAVRSLSTQHQPTTTATATTLRLVAYRGSQLPGYTVRQVPAGYELQGISGAVLDVAEQGDQTSLDSFVGKLVVMLDDHPAIQDGATPVQVNGHQGYLRTEDDAMILSWNDGDHNVTAEMWNNIHLTPDQLVTFAEGVTVLPDAQVGHG